MAQELIDRLVALPPSDPAGSGKSDNDSRMIHALYTSVAYLLHRQAMAEQQQQQLAAVNEGNVTTTNVRSNAVHAAQEKRRHHIPTVGIPGSSSSSVVPSQSTQGSADAPWKAFVADTTRRMREAAGSPPPPVQSCVGGQTALSDAADDTFKTHTDVLALVTKLQQQYALLEAQVAQQRAAGGDGSCDTAPTTARLATTTSAMLSPSMSPRRSEFLLEGKQAAASVQLPPPAEGEREGQQQAGEGTAAGLIAALEHRVRSFEKRLLTAVTSLAARLKQISRMAEAAIKIPLLLCIDDPEDFLASVGEQLTTTAERVNFLHDLPVFGSILAALRHLADKVRSLEEELASERAAKHSGPAPSKGTTVVKSPTRPTTADKPAGNSTTVPPIVLSSTSQGETIVGLPRNDPPIWLGLEVGDAVDVGSGVVVVDVFVRSPAYMAGVRPGDLITAYNGQSVKTTADFLALKGRARDGDHIMLKLYGTMRHLESPQMVTVVAAVAPEAADIGPAVGAGATSNGSWPVAQALYGEEASSADSATATPRLLRKSSSSGSSFSRVPRPNQTMRRRQKPPAPGTTAAASHPLYTIDADDYRGVGR